MNRWTIEIDYTTGDSFSSNRTTSELGISWTSLGQAKEALARIKEMHEIEQEHGRFWKMSNEGKTPRPLTDAKGYSKEHEYSIMLPLDDGSEHPHAKFWEGHFETLHGAKVVSVGDTDMAFETRF